MGQINRTIVFCRGPSCCVAGSGRGGGRGGSTCHAVEVPTDNAAVHCSSEDIEKALFITRSQNTIDVTSSIGSAAPRMRRR